MSAPAKPMDMLGGGTSPRARTARFLAIVACAGSLLAVAGSVAAQAQGTDPGELLVDATHGHVFAAPASGSGGVDVYDLDGVKLTTLDVPNADGLAVAGGTLFVAPCSSGDTISRFDLGTLAPAAPVTVPGLDATCKLTQAGGRVWFYWWTGHKLVSIAADGTVNTFAGVGADQPGLLMGLPGNRLVEVSGTGLTELDVSTATPTVATSVAYTDSVFDVQPLGSTGDLLVTANGTVRQLAASDLHEKARYGPLGFAQRSAGSASGSEVAAVTTGPSGSAAEGFVVATGEQTLREPEGGSAIAFGPGDRLYLLGGGLTVITDASLRSTSITVTPSVTSTNVGASIGVSGTLAFVNQATGVRTLNVTAAGPNGAQVDLGQVSTAADGSYTAQVAFPAAGTWTVTVAFPGDASHRASQATSTGLPVYKLRSRPGISLSKHIITYGQQITIRIQLKHWHTNRTVELTRKTVGKPRVSLGMIDVGPTGIVTLTVKPRANSTYRADWAGDDWYAAGQSNEPPVDVHALVRDGIAGGYAIRSGVHLIHYHASCASQHRSCPVVHGTVLPNHAGKQVYFTLQVRANGSWHTFATAHFRIPSTGTKSVGLVYRNRSVIGLLQRFRADFGGDADHLRGRGRWVKFMVTG